MKKTLVIILALALMLTACSKKEPADPNIQTTTTQKETKANNPLQKSNSDTLNLAMPAGVTIFNPLDTSSSTMVNIFWLSYNSLFRVGAQGKIEGELVENFTFENGVYNFTLRSGVTFHNGNKLTANDVKYSVSKLKDKGDENQARNTIYANAKDIIEDITVKDDLNFSMKLKAGGISPLYSLVFPIMCSDGTNNGTGSYKMTAAKADGMSFEAYDKSWRTQPKIKKIQAIPFANDDEISKAYKDNKIDVVFVNHGNVGLYKFVQNTKTLNTRTNNYYYLMPNMLSGKMSNLQNRQAIGYAINKDKVVSRAFDSNAIISDGPVPADYFVFDNELRNYYHDVGESVRIFGKQGYKQVKDGTKTFLKKGEDVFTLRVIAIKSGDLYNQNIASTLQNQLGELGVKVDVQLLNEEDYKKAISNGNYDLAVASTQISSEFNLRFMLGTGGSKNINGFKSAEMDKALDSIANSGEDMVKVKDGFSQLQSILVKSLPQYGLCFTTDTLVYNDRVQGVGKTQSNNMMINIINWSFEKVDETSTVTTID